MMCFAGVDLSERQAQQISLSQKLDVPAAVEVLNRRSYYSHRFGQTHPFYNPTPHIL